MADYPTQFTREVFTALAGPFADNELEFLPRSPSNGKALALVYIDARAVMRRLDAVVGPANWSWDYDVISPDGKMIRGRLTVLGVTKCDAGEAATEDEILKSAVSDALKRCGVLFGIGRYLYELPKVFAPYDAQKRRFTEQPRLDRGAVERALQLCGVGNGAPRTESRPAHQGPRQPSPYTPEPESRGDQRAAQVVTAAEKPNAYAHETGARPVAPPRQEPSELRMESPTGMACTADGCGKALTKGQHDISVRAYGAPFCPACQKGRPEVAR